MAAPQPVSIDSLGVEQLAQVKNQLDEELQVLTSSFTALKGAQAKFAAGMESADSITASNKDKTVLVPLTSSLYAPGRLKDPEHVLLDLGTGYFVEKTPKEAKASLNGKILNLRGQLDSLQTNIQTKEEHRAVVLEELKHKIASTPK